MPSSAIDRSRSKARVEGFRSVKRIDMLDAKSALSFPTVDAGGDLMRDELRHRREQKSQTKQLKTVTLNITNIFIE